MRWLIIFILLTGTAMAETVPIGPASWRNSDNSITKVIGPGGEPTFNYQKADGMWDFIIDDWMQVGDKQVWKSVQGNHRVFADSTGAAIYAKGEHYLGTETIGIIKWKISDSTWTMKASAMPDSVTMRNRTITFHNIFPGVDKQLVNNPKAFKMYAETFIFHQAGRDTIATYGPWAGYLLGTVTRLNIDSLNLSWQDAVGHFNITDTGRMTDGWIKGMDADTMVFTIANSYLQTEDSTTSIVVNKRVVLIAGIPYLIELFNPMLTASLPTGDLWHNATFGYSTAGGSSEIIEDVVFGNVASPGSNGTRDSITGYYFSNGAAKSARMGLFIENTSLANQDLIDSTAEFSINGANAWYSKEALVGVSITSSDQYSICVWASSETGNGFGYSAFTQSAEDTMWHNSGITYEAAWTDPITASNIEHDNAFSIYCFYTEVGAPPAGQVFIIGANDEKDDLIPVCLRDIECERMGDRIRNQRDLYIFDSRRTDMR